VERAEGVLVPVVVRCEPPALSKQHRWYDLPAGPLQIDIDVHAPWAAQSFVSADVRGADGADAAGGDALAGAGPEGRTKATREMTRALAAFYAQALGFTPDAAASGSAASSEQQRT
jgi:hypothetical protein